MGTVGQITAAQEVFPWHTQESAANTAVRELSTTKSIKTCMYVHYIPIYTHAGFTMLTLAALK